MTRIPFNPKSALTLLSLLIFGSLGVLARYGLDSWISKHWNSPSKIELWGLSTHFPLGTAIVNLTGCLLGGLLSGLMLETEGGSPELRLGLSVGFLGGFTTFSAYALQSVRLAEQGSLTESLIYGMGSPILGVASVGLGLWLGRTARGLL